MKSKPRIANQAIYLSRAACNLRVAAERVAGICEWVAFIVNGSLGDIPRIRSVEEGSQSQPGQPVTL
jgi:hypothetical protein